MASRRLDISADLTVERIAWRARVPPDGSSVAPRSQGRENPWVYEPCPERFSE